MATLTHMVELDDNKLMSVNCFNGVAAYGLKVRAQL